MITKYYTVSVKSSTNYNIFNDFKDDPKAIILELEKGKPMWFCYYLEDDIAIPWHRVKTSPVINITKQDLLLTSNPPIQQEEVIVETENSIYRFIYTEDKETVFNF